MRSDTRLKFLILLLGSIVAGGGLVTWMPWWFAVLAGGFLCYMIWPRSSDSWLKEPLQMAPLFGIFVLFGELDKASPEMKFFLGGWVVVFYGVLAVIHKEFRSCSVRVEQMESSGE